jgi:hypothetical protein
MAGIGNVILAAQKRANTWRAFWILLSLGLVAVGAGAPGGFGIP